MSEDISWTKIQDATLLASCESELNNEMTILPSIDTDMSSHWLKTDTIDTNLYNDLRFFDHDENKLGGDPFDYEWPGLENFEDVDHMFRICDSTFGTGSVSNEQDTSWFSSSPSRAIESSENAFKSGLESSCSDSKRSENIVCSRKNYDFGSKHKDKVPNEEQYKDMPPYKKLCSGMSDQISSISTLTNTKPNFSKNTHDSKSKAAHNRHAWDTKENYKKVGGVSMDSSNVHESFDVGSVSNRFSAEETSFRQLLHVVEKLDLRTRICIRDSLYRLARIAEKRSDGSNTDGSGRGDTNNECTRYLDMETDTNPIDRSIAHLLFHRPSDPSVKSTKDA